MGNLPARTYAFIFLNGMIFLFNSCKKNEPAPLVINPTVNPIHYSVMAYLITPTDQSFNSQYYIGERACILNLQAWYKSQMGNKSLSGLHNSSWYNTNHGDSISGTTPAYAYHNVKYEMKQLLGANFDTVHFAYFIYVVADFPDETIPRGLAAEGLENLLDISGESPHSWMMGAAGHALGHAFGLPEPTVENSNGIMSGGTGKYPNCILTQAEKDTLNASPFFQIH